MQAQNILDFWFQELDRQYWFRQADHIDELIRQRFENVTQQAARGELAHWRQTQQGRLAEILLLDQFPRNIWRDDPKAFAQDGMALVLAQEALARPGFARLSQLERHFTLLPLMHSESALIHQQAVPLFTRYSSPEGLDFELRHKAIIDRFGRYPHRNDVLGRQSTPEEIEFLIQPGSHF